MWRHTGVTKNRNAGGKLRNIDDERVIFRSFRCWFNLCFSRCLQHWSIFVSHLQQLFKRRHFTFVIAIVFSAFKYAPCFRRLFMSLDQIVDRHGRSIAAFILPFFGLVDWEDPLSKVLVQFCRIVGWLVHLAIRIPIYTCHMEPHIQYVFYYHIIWSIHKTYVIWASIIWVRQT